MSDRAGGHESVPLASGGDPKAAGSIAATAAPAALNFKNVRRSTPKVALLGSSSEPGLLILELSSRSDANLHFESAPQWLGAQWFRNPLDTPRVSRKLLVYGHLRLQI